VEQSATNYLYWGNLGDAYRWAPGQRDKSKEAYGRAIELVREKMAASADDPFLQANLAGYLAKAGDRRQALAELVRFEQLPRKSAEGLFKAAIAYEVCGQRQNALRLLEAAMHAGYSLQQIRNEQELTDLRAEVRYQRMVSALDRSTERTTGTPKPERKGDR
jgi:tetratricopeptide (TPR) repeat protein